MKRLFQACAALAAMSACARHYADDTLVERVRAIRPSVVLLTAKVPAEHRGQYDQEYATGTVVASGDWGSDILSVGHGVQGALALSVTIGNRRTVTGSVVARDSKFDVALVRVPVPRLPPVALGTSAPLVHQLGREVGLIGYPIPDQFDEEGLGLNTSLATGAISSVRKDTLEVTTSIVPGDSGAALFLVDTGEIVGIAESRFEEERSIGFALPIDDAKPFLHRVDAGHGL